MTTRIRKAALVALAALTLVSASYEAALSKARDANQHGNAYSVTLICPRLAEDSAAHVRLVTYEHSTAPGSNTVIVYRCKRFGY